MLSGIPKPDIILIGTDLNDHVGRNSDGYGGVHGVWELVQEMLNARGF